MSRCMDMHYTRLKKIYRNRLLMLNQKDASYGYFLPGKNDATVLFLFD